MSPIITERIRGFVPNLPVNGSVKAVEVFLKDGNISLDFGVFEKFIPEQFWGVQRSRSEGRRAHAWFFLREWISAYDQISVEQRRDLVQTFSEIFPSWKAMAQLPDSMAYHDETTAQRVINSTYFLAQYRTEIDELAWTTLEHNVEYDIALLRSDEFYAGENNHGMFQNIALLVAHVLGFATKDDENLAIKRLVAYFDACFTGDGIHKENNPSYHVMGAHYLKLVTLYLRDAENPGQLGHLAQVLELADLYAGFCVTPSGKFPPISDTKLVENTAGQARRFFGEGYFLGAVTGGSTGKLPRDTTFIAEESGYAVFRDGWTADSKYAFFSAAYNDDYHKHSDELSVFVHANGHDILSEAGPNGYQYKDSFTRYAFSSFAHNTLLVDGEGLPRVDGKAELTALEKLGEKVVRGKTLRYEGVEWQRTVDATHWSHDGLLMMKDEIKSDTKHKYTMLWHAGQEMDVVVRGNFVEFFSHTTKEKVGELYVEGSAVSAVRHIRGQTKPHVQGFYFPSMGTNVPASVIEYDVDSQVVSLSWQFRTQNFLLNDRGITPYNRQWKTFYGEKPVRYVLDWAGEGDPDSLLLVFSAVNPINDFTFNYRASLKGFNGAVAYIIDDFGDQGSYYLANGREKAEFRSVQSAIEHIVRSVNVKMDNVYAIGSSKGGAGAIMHGVTAGVRRVFAGGPQYKIGLFTSKPHPNILKYVSGGTTDDDVEWADNAILDILKAGNRATSITLLVGRADGHYKHHAVPFADDARSLGYSVRLLSLPGTVHSELGGVFRQFVMSLCSSTQEDSVVTAHAIAANTKSQELGVVVDAEENWEVLAQLQKDNQNIGKRKRVVDGKVSWKVPEKGVYRVRLYVDRQDGAGRRGFGTAAQRV